MVEVYCRISALSLKRIHIDPWSYLMFMLLLCGWPLLVISLSFEVAGWGENV